MLATYAASRHRQIVPCCMISSVSHDNVSRLVTDRSMCFATALDKAFENIDCMSAILRCQAKNRFYESTQRLIQPRRVLWINTQSIKEHMEILGSDGQHVGAVDRLDGKDKIKLTKADLKSGGQHHVIPLTWVAKVDTHVHLSKPAKDAMAQSQAAA